MVVRVLRSVSWRVHSWSETIPFQGASTICSPSSMALARTTSSSAVSRATLPISLRYIRTGSSIPIMSAEMASSSSAEGSSTSFGSSLAGASDGSLAAGIGGAVLGDDDDADVGTVLAASTSGPRSRSSSSSSSSSPATATPALGRDGRRPASLASSRSALARRGRDRTASTSCLSRGSADMGYLRWLASSRVWSRRRSRDRRASLI